MIKLAFQKASDWLVHSGIQNLSQNKKLRGGVAAWYELDKGIYPFLYSEITGYALSSWMFLYQIKSDQEFLRRAQMAADWLMGNALHDIGGIKTRFYLVKDYVTPNYCFRNGNIYSFDTAMVGYGLLQLFKVSKDQRVFQSVERIVNFLVRYMKKKEGAYYPYFNRNTHRCGEDFGKWSDQGGSFHAKLALLLIDYYRITGNGLYKEYALELLGAVMKIQKKDGRYITGKKDGSTHLHPLAYTLEGLLYGGVYLNQTNCLDSAIKGFLWMLRGVSHTGSVSSICEKETFSHHERSDIISQVLRIGSILYALDPKKMRRHLPILENVKRHLLLFQYQLDKRQLGGFIYGFATDGLMRNHLNAWSTMFALQALWMYDEFVIKKKKLFLESFI